MDTALANQRVNVMKPDAVESGQRRTGPSRAGEGQGRLQGLEGQFGIQQADAARAEGPCPFLVERIAEAGAEAGGVGLHHLPGAQPRGASPLVGV